MERPNAGPVEQCRIRGERRRGGTLSYECMFMNNACKDRSARCLVCRVSTPKKPKRRDVTWRDMSTVGYSCERSKTITIYSNRYDQYQQQHVHRQGSRSDKVARGRQHTNRNSTNKTKNNPGKAFCVLRARNHSPHTGPHVTTEHRPCDGITRSSTASNNNKREGYR